MRTMKRLLSGLLSVILCLCLFACDTPPADGGAESETASQDTQDTQPVETMPLIEDGSFLFRIIRSEQASTMVNNAAFLIRDHLSERGIEVKLTTDFYGSKPETYEVLVGQTKYTPEGADAGIDLTTLGYDGFIIRTVGNKILLLAHSDFGVYNAAEFFINEFLKDNNGDKKMPAEYCYVQDNGTTMLEELLLGGKNISAFALTCESDALNESLTALGDLIKEKCGITLTSEGAQKILLTTSGADADKVTAKMENGDLVIRAKDAAAMKKAIVCFWYENIDFVSGKLDLASDFTYERDLTKTVFYSDFDVKQSENECCLAQIVAAHNYANEHGYKVFADYGAKYYINTPETVTIKTDVEWGNAQFTIDDSNLAPERGKWLFAIPSSHAAYTISGIASVDRTADHLDITLPQKSIVTIRDDTTKQYIRYGGNANSGDPKTDRVVVDKDGKIDMSAPFMWDFDNVTSVSVLPIDETLLTISGGSFTTIANQAPSEYTYYGRGLMLTRSNTLVRNVKHYIVGEGPTGAPYSGFFAISNAAYVTYENCVMSGHKTYQSPTTPMGSYDINPGNSISITYKNCVQANDIMDKTLWGVMGSNYSKNLVFDGCVLSRFDAHCGVTNATIKNSVIGRCGASIVGYGTALFENSTFLADSIIGLREDYGSTWEGDVIIRNCKVMPTDKTKAVYMISGKATDAHDFGYPCYAPINVTIDGLRVETNGQVFVFSDLNPNHTTVDYSAAYPYIPTETVTVKGFSSKKELLLSPNMVFFGSTEFTVE